jgi:hypothetical protein
MSDEPLVRERVPIEREYLKMERADPAISQLWSACFSILPDQKPRALLDGYSVGALAIWALRPACAIARPRARSRRLKRAGSSETVVRVLLPTASSNLVGCSIGRSAGFAPRRTLSTRLTTCR